MEYFNFLPEEITLDILTRLPTESVLDCKLVCTYWRSLVRHPSFSKIHFHYHISNPDSNPGKLAFIALTQNNENIIQNFQYFEYNENHDPSTTPIEKITKLNFASPFTGTKRFLGSCNGLICFSQYRFYESPFHGPVCICNPITKEYVMLPEIKTDFYDADKYVRCWRNAFGYVSSINEYKVMGIMLANSFGDSVKFVEVYVCTLGSGTGWRKLVKRNSDFMTYNWQKPIFVNEALYWIDSPSGKILTFDLSKEMFCENLSPPPLQSDNGYWHYNKIGALDGCLYFAMFLLVEKAPHYDIWLLRKKHDNHDMKLQPEEHQSMVWSKEFRVSERGLFVLTKSGSALTYNLRYLKIYDTKASTSKTLVEFKERFWGVYPHRNTLVSLKEIGEEDIKIMKPVEGDRELVSS